MRVLGAIIFVAALAWIYWIYAANVAVENTAKGTPTPPGNSKSKAGNVGDDI